MIEQIKIDVAGVQTRVLSSGNGGTPVVFLHGGIPGVTPYCGSAQFWERTLLSFAPSGQAVAIDLLASGETGYKIEQSPLVVDDLGGHFQAALDALGIAKAHVVGHDLGGLVAFWLALRDSTRFVSLSVVASAASAPIGDWVDDLVYSAPPTPLWTAESQRWALERVSFNPAHVDREMIAACIVLSDGEGPRTARDLMSTEKARAAFNASMSRLKSKLWALARDSKLDVPFQIISAADDPLTTPAHGLTLFQTLGATQPIAQYHLVSRCGSFVFREQPKQFFRILSAFHEGLANTEPMYRYA